MDDERVLKLMEHPPTPEIISEIESLSEEMRNEWLITAAFKCNIEMCKILVERGADVNYVIGDDDETGDMSVLTALLSLSVKDKPLEQYKELFDYLLEKGVDVNRRESRAGYSCIDLMYELQNTQAEMDKSSEMIIYILNKKVLDLTSGEKFNSDITGVMDPRITKRFWSNPILYKACITAAWIPAIQSAIIRNSIDPEREIRMLSRPPLPPRPPEHVSRPLPVHELFHVNYGEAFLEEVYDKYKQAEINAQQFRDSGRAEANDFEEDRASFLNCLTELRNVYDTLQQTKKAEIDRLHLGKDTPLYRAYQIDLANKNMLHEWISTDPKPLLNLAFAEPIGEWEHIQGIRQTTTPRQRIVVDRYPIVQGYEPEDPAVSYTLPGGRKTKRKNKKMLKTMRKRKTFRKIRVNRKFTKKLN